MPEPLLSVQELSVEYRTRKGRIRAVDDVSFSLGKAETIGIVGESGSGKSTLGLSLIGLVPYPGEIVKGNVFLAGKEVLKLKKDELRNLRGTGVCYVFQDPMTSLNPVKKIGDHFVEMIRTHQPELTRKEALERAAKLLKDVGIQAERINDYPHQLSGGMRQRVMIALAITLNPQVVVADEPTTALDVIVQAKILDLLNALRDTYGMALVLITHDLSIVLERSDRIIVMYAGQVVEYAQSRSLYQEPQHPYTQGLLKSIPNVELADQKLEAIDGSPPDLLNLRGGCRFTPRCKFAFDRCPKEDPPLYKTDDGRLVRCFLYDKQGGDKP
ncbi:MAG: ABC transporter ATP-binding protein [Candidatus Bathyarchaeia archaeon]